MAKGRRSKKKQEKRKIDLAVVGMLITSILLAILIYTNSGYIGEHLSPMLGGIMGFMKYVLPIGTFAIGIYLALDDKEYLYTKLVQYAVFLVAISAVFSIYQISIGTLDASQDFSTVVRQAYELGESNVGGGVIGICVA